MEEEKNNVVSLIRRDNHESEELSFEYNSSTGEIRVYLDGQEIDMGELIRTYEDIEPIKDIINKVKENEGKNDDKDLEDSEEDIIEKYSGAVGIDEEEIEEIDELDLDQELKEKENDQEPEMDANEANTLTKKEETNLEQRIKGVSLRNALGLSEEYVKIAIVSSSQVNKYTNPEKRHGNIDSFVAIKANGEAIVLGEDIIKQDRQEGINSTAVDLTANVNGEVDYEKNRSSYQFVKSPNLYLKVGYDENLGREIKVEDRSRGRGADGMVYELETNATWRADDDQRRMQRDREGIYAADDAMDQQNKHEENSCKNDRVENIDQYKGNDLHEHIIKADDLIPGTDTTWRQFANMCGYRGEDALEKAQKELENYKKDYPDVDNEQAIEEIQEEIENEMPGPNRDRR